MYDKKRIQTVAFLAFSVIIFVPLWGTFHAFVGVKIGWVAFASAALFFAMGHELKDSPKAIVGHLMGVGWGVSHLSLLNRSEFQNYNNYIISVLVLIALGALAVIITHIGIDLLSHLPSLFSGWAITVATLGGKSFSQWTGITIDISLGIIAGILFLGIGISQTQKILLSLVSSESEKESAEDVNKKMDKVKHLEVVKKQKSNNKLDKYISAYNTQKKDKIKTSVDKNDIEDLKNEIINISKIVAKKPTAQYSGASYQDVPVKIVGVCGSPHKKGSTIEYVKKTLEAAATLKNVSVELIELSGKKIKPCNACKTDKCHGTCIIKDDMQDIYPILRDCDGIILGSPSYFGTYSAQLKIFIDRLRVLRHTDFELANKVVAPLSVAGRRHGGQEITNLDIVQSMMRHNTIIVNDGTTVCQLGATGWSHAFDDSSLKIEDDVYGLQTAEGVGLRIAEIAKVIKFSGMEKKVYKYNAKIGKR